MAKNEKQTRKQQSVNLEGSRIVNVEQLQKYSSDLNRPAAMQCEGSFVLSGEVRDGLASILSGQCST